MIRRDGVPVALGILFENPHDSIAGLHRKPWRIEIVIAYLDDEDPLGYLRARPAAQPEEEHADERCYQSC
jgi:hypothetical protein